MSKQLYLHPLNVNFKHVILLLVTESKTIVNFKTIDSNLRTANNNGINDIYSKINL